MFEGNGSFTLLHEVSRKHARTRTIINPGDLMKFTLIAILIFSSLSSFAVPVSKEASMVSRVLVNSPEVVAKLNQAGITTLTDIKSITIKPGVTKYVLKYGRFCECIPATAVVTVLEDATPTYADGLPEYQSDVQIVEEQVNP